MPKKNPDNFEKNYEKLAGIVSELESENLDLETSVKKFEEGLKIADSLKARLREVENKIKVIKKTFS